MFQAHININIPATDGRRAHKAKLFMISEMKSLITVPTRLALLITRKTEQQLMFVKCDTVFRITNTITG